MDHGTTRGPTTFDNANSAGESDTAGRTMSSPSTYRGYFIDHLNHVQSIVVIEAADVESACSQAETLLTQTRYAAVEIWDGPRIVGVRSAGKWKLWPFGSSNKLSNAG
jgi:hypothetical protein